MNVYLPNLRLPSAYQEVEYIQSSGAQYINTGYIGTQNTKIEATINIVSRNANYDMLYGSTSTGTGGYPCMFIQHNYPENNKLRIVNYINSGSGKRYIDSINNLQYNKTFSIIHTNTAFIIDGVTQGTCSSSTFTLDYPFYIFCCNEHSRAGAFCNMRLYSFKIYSGTTLQRDFVPCYRKSDNVIGLYDLVNKQFYTNSGTGTFSKGNDVTMTMLKNAYIGDVYEYSYDFRGKSVAKMQSDGWNIFLNSNHAIFNSNGINTNSTNNAIMAKIENLNSIIKNSKKITLSFTGAITNAFSGRLSLFNEATSSTRRGITGPYVSNYESTIQTSLYTTDITDSRTVNSTMTVTTVLDFTAKTWKTTATDGYSRSGTLTDTQISNIKNNSKGFYIFAATSTSNTNGGLTSIYVLVE